jgi:hypothetical protein
VSVSSKVRSTRQGSKVGFPNSPCARKSVSAESWSAMCEMVSRSESSLEVYCVQGSMCGLLCSCWRWCTYYCAFTDSRVAGS